MTRIAILSPKDLVLRPVEIGCDRYGKTLCGETYRRHVEWNGTALRFMAGKL